MSYTYDEMEPTYFIEVDTFNGEYFEYCSSLAKAIQKANEILLKNDGGHADIFEVVGEDSTLVYEFEK